MEIVLNIGIVLSFFLSILLFSKKGKVLTDNIMSIWLFVIGIHLTGYFLHNKGYWEAYPHLIGTTAPIPFLYGPLLYLYVSYSLRDKKYIKKVDVLHFAPVLISYLYLTPFYFFYSAEEKTLVDKGLIDDFGVFTSIMLIGFIVSGIVYSIVSIKILNKREKLVQENFSNNDRIDMSWLRYTIWGVISFFAVAALVTILKELIGFKFPFNADILFYSIITGFVVYVGYSGIRQKDLFFNAAIKEDELVQTESTYKKSSLKHDLAIKKHKELLELMSLEKPFLNPKLTISELANRLSLSTNHLSQIINQQEKVNFHDFVNKFRVEEFIQNAKHDSSNYNLLGIAYDSGFNSKSTFNSVFKKFKSVTPSQYLSNLKS